MKYVQEIEDHANLRALVFQDLKDLSIKPPKSKKNKVKDDSIDYGAPGVFGTHLVLVPVCMVEYCGPVPKFLVDAFHLLEKHIDTEGLFRKSGSVARQKELKQKAESGEDFNDAHPFDVASLVKQFFRELPDPLLTSRLHDTFLKCHQVEPEHARVSAILLLCHLLPWQHLSTLRFTMCFLRKIADKAEVNKMDVPNLAVCLAPNLLHTNNKNDKMNTNESKLLQIQTSIVQYLITNAESIGMVSDSLYERTTLMLSCFASEDELEKSDAGMCNDSNMGKKKKKKKRSGSFQGLVSNLSNSFSKWRRDSKGHNQSNISDKSTMSVLSMADKSSILVDCVDGGYVYEYETNPLCPEATPKLMRKRKAEDEAVPFSASKKKAILQNMPQNSALGSTPFRTPATLRKGSGRDLLTTPNIKFADNSDMVFNATPRMKMEQMLLSPNSATKVKRNASGKSSCFTPKTPKSNMKRKMRGFLRRLSGGKEPQPGSPGSALLNSSDIGAKLSSQDIPDYVTIIDPANGGQRKGSMFRRHRKTPSSPARLVTNMLDDDDHHRHDRITPDSSCSSLVSSVSGTSSNPSITNLELMARLQGGGVRSPATSSEISLEDKARARSDSQDGNLSMGNKSGLRRGKPNTLRSGLPSPAKRRSLDTSNIPGGEQQDIVLSTVDTSPIQKIEPMMHDDEDDEHSPVIHHLDYGSDEESSSEGSSSEDEDDDDDEEEEDMHENMMHRQLSATSIMSVAESDHDRAFIHESMLADMTNIEELESGPKNCEGALAAGNRDLPVQSTPEASADTNHDTTSDDGFKKPIGLPISSSSAKLVDKSDATTSAKTKGPMKAMPIILGQSKSDSKLSRAKSVDSVDSGIGSDDGKLSKSASLQSIGSMDSGVSLEKESVEKAHTMPLQRLPSIRRGSGAEPNLQITTDMHGMLSRAGIVSESKRQDFEKELSQEVESPSGEDATNEVSERQRNPLRFPNSQTRKRGVSPIRIPTIFAKADQEAAQKYRGLARASMRPCSPKRKANLPIGTGLVNAGSVQNARTRLMACPDQSPIEEVNSNQSTPTSDTISPSAGHTPKYPLGSKPALVVKDSENIENEGTIATPKIKPMLMKSDVTKRLLAVVPPSAETPVRKTARSPIKPVKRLQGSPKSPKNRHFKTSPGKMKTLPQHGERLSPMPAHMATDWGV